MTYNSTYLTKLFSLKIVAKFECLQVISAVLDCFRLIFSDVIQIEIGWDIRNVEYKMSGVS